MLIVAVLIAVVLTPTAVVAIGQPRWAARPMRRALSRGAERAMITSGHGLKAASASTARAGKATASRIGRGTRGTTRAGRTGLSRALWAVADHLTERAAGPVPVTLGPEKASEWGTRLTRRAGWWRRAGDLVSRATRVTCSCGNVSVDTAWRNNSAAHLKTCRHRHGGTVADRLAKHRARPAPPSRGPRSPATTNPGHHPDHAGRRTATTGGGTMTNTPYLGRLAEALHDISNLEMPRNTEEFAGQVQSVAQIHLLFSESLMGWVEALAARKDPKTGEPAPIDPRVTQPLSTAAGGVADQVRIVLETIERMHRVYAKQFEAAAARRQGAPEETFFRP